MEKPLEKRLEEYIEEDIRWKKEDKEWKEKAQPALDAFNNLSATRKMIVGFFATAGIILGAIGALFLVILNGEKLINKP